MKTLLALLLMSTTAIAAESCSVLPTTCPGKRLSCTFVRECVDAQGCINTQTVYIQDCSPIPTPKYCSAQHTLVLKSRKAC